MFESSVDCFRAVLYGLLLLLGATFLFVNWIKTCDALPPGPRPLPLIGTILQTIGRDFRDVCKEYRKTYGDIFTLYVFNTPIIVLNGFETLKEVFVDNGNLFSERHPIDLCDAAIGGEGIARSSGAVWKRNRRFAIRTLRDFGMGKKLETIIHKEITYFLDALDEEKGHPFAIEHLITAFVSNVMCLLLFGQRFAYTNEDFIIKLNMMREIFECNFLMVPSWTRHIPGDPFHMQRSFRHMLHFSDFYRSKIREHFKDFDENGQRDVIDAYIKLSKADDVTTDGTSRINDDEMVRILDDLFAGGTETIATVLKFGIVCLLRNPEIQEKVFAEITKYVPDNRLPNIDDMKNLPYTKATILEILRRASPGPFAIPHRTKTDTKYHGYTIPRSAIIIPNLESVLHDPTVWKETIEFSPARFQNISREKENIPFGLGPRICPGENMARTELSLIFTPLLQRFRLCLPEGENPPSLSTQMGTTCPPFPFKLKVVRRM